MDWTAAIDLYCERSSAGFWAEPVNAWSNLAFPVAALAASLGARRRSGASPDYWVLVALAALVGLGSFLFHTVAEVWSEYADTIPIWSFVAGSIAVALAGLAAAVAFIVVFLSATDPRPAVPPPPDPLNGSGQYAPALAALVAFAAISWVRRMPARGLLVAAALVFLAALVFRSVDLRICSAFPLGTHVLWHLLNGLMVGLVLWAMLPADRQRQPR